jgi:hypothetical protein
MIKLSAAPLIGHWQLVSYPIGRIAGLSDARRSSSAGCSARTTFADATIKLLVQGPIAARMPKASSGGQSPGGRGGDDVSENEPIEEHAECGKVLLPSPQETEKILR